MTELHVLHEEAIADRARRWAAVLRERGVVAGDRIAVRGGNQPEMVAARDATTILGCAFVPVNPRLAAPEVEHIVAASGARLFIDGDDGFADLDAAAATVEPLPAPSPGTVGATVLFTSGTTGRPKGCLRTEAQEAVRAAELVATYGLGPDEVHLVACPLAHSAPGIFLRAVRAVGGRVLLLSRWDGAAFLSAVAAHRVTSAFLVPTQVERLLDLADAGLADWSSMRALIVAGAPFAPATKQRLLRWIGEGRLWEFYGSSETGTVTVLPPAEQPGGAGCVGRPPPGVELRLAEDGEIFVRSPAVMERYLDEPPRADDGFVSVGDVGRFDEAGRLVLVDRKIDLVITGGANVYPAEVEHALREHPAVAVAVVTGVPRDEWGEEVVAVVAVRTGAPPDEAALKQFLRSRIAAYKVPRRIRFLPIEEMPVGSSGKPLRRVARRLFTAE